MFKSKWFERIAIFILGGLTLPLIVAGMSRVWSWSFETGPQLLERSAGLLMFIIVLVLLLAVLVVLYLILKTVQKSHREKAVADRDTDAVRDISSKTDEDAVPSRKVSRVIDDPKYRTDAS